MNEAVLGIDIGTTGIKALLVDGNGDIVGRGYYEYALITKQGGIVEQNAEDWIKGTIISVHEALSNTKEKYNVTALSLSTQGASMTAVDKNNKALCNVITWMDRRASKEKNYLAEKIGSDKIYRKTGYNVAESSDSTKILWLKNNKPDIQAYKYISTLEYVNYFLIGKHIIDPSNAGIRGMYNINTRTWDDEILSVMGINDSVLPTVCNAGTYLGNLSAEAADLLALDNRNKIKVYNGAHDQYCAALGSETIKNCDMLLSAGTTWVVLGISDKIVYSDSYISPGIHPVEGVYGELTSIKNGGSALKWYKELISAESYSDIDNTAEKRIKNISDLYFSPFFNGSGFPHKNPEMLSGIYGLQLYHDKYDLALALMECTAFEIKTVLKEYQKQGININSIKMLGGASKSKLWAELTGYITGCDITLMKESEACALGAALIAGVGCGMFDGYGNVNKSVKLDLNNDEIKEHYSFKYKKYLKYLESVRYFENSLNK